MGTTCYAALLQLFNDYAESRRAPYIPAYGFTPDNIRYSYRKAMDEYLAPYEIYQVPLASQNNPITQVIILDGPANDKIPTELISNEDDMAFVMIMPEEFRGPMDEELYIKYVNTVSRYIRDIISYDRLFGLGKYGIYPAALNAMPIYFTYWHVKNYVSHIDGSSDCMLEKWNDWDEFIEHEISNGPVNMPLNKVNTLRDIGIKNLKELVTFSSDPCNIYRTMYTTV